MGRVLPKYGGQWFSHCLTHLTVDNMSFNRKLDWCLSLTVKLRHI